MEKNKKWDIFEDLTAKCYKSQDNGNIIKEHWYSAYDILLEIIEEERKKSPECFVELAEIDQKTEYKYNVQSWVDDYFKELSTLGDYDRIYRDGTRLINAFQWQEQSPAEIKLRVINAMERLGMHEAASRCSEEWVVQNPDNINALFAALIFGERDCMKENVIEES
ncbi:hypothetical protein IMSAGC011_01311 [Lachnospiraceae bacterium]|nr:hypothetical protein IMSAGC011_01311 [Lachnospiraceae bacterium]